MNNTLYSSVAPVLEPYQACLLLLVGFGGLASLLAFLYNWIQARVFGDANNLDRAFDAGGNVSASLTAVTVAVQLLWPADLLQSASVTAKFGIAGGFWYSSAIVVNIILFPLLSITFKTRAPGAKTYLQIIRARFGARTHIVYCVFALLTNIVVTSVILVAGQALFKTLIDGISDALLFILIASLFGSYAFIGGVGSTFYVSYANAAVTFAILCYYLVQLFYVEDEDLIFGSMADIYNNVIKLEGPVDNKDRNYLTFLSLDSIVWMVQGVFVAASVTFCDQASWQSRIAAKPLQGVLGFFFATFIWFAIPATIGTTSGLIYLSYSEGGNNTNALSSEDIDAGLVTSFIAQRALGDLGGVLVLIMFTMLMMATGSGEVMGITSIIVYDIYQTYIYPFKKNVKPGHCILCDGIASNETYAEATVLKEEDNNMVGLSHYCKCPSVHECLECKVDLTRQQQVSKHFKFATVSYGCSVHGAYRTYQDSMIRVKNWVVMSVSLALVPLGLFLVASGIDLNWIFLTGSVVTTHTFPGVVLAIVWVKTRGWTLVVGGIVGLLSGTAACLYRASILEGGLSNFLLNTSEGYAVMAGSCTSFAVSLVLEITLSTWSHQIKTKDDEAREWQKLRDIDNPLRPWEDQFREEIQQPGDRCRPSYTDIDRHYRKAKIVANVGTIICIILFVVTIPGVMSSMEVLTLDQFKSYLMTLQLWTGVMACLVIVLVPLEEILRIGKQLRRRRLFSSEAAYNSVQDAKHVAVMQEINNV